MADETLRKIYELAKWGSTSANCGPARFVFLRSREAKGAIEAGAAGNLEKTLTAPVTVIVAYDLKFYEKLPKLFPHNPGMRNIFAATRNLSRSPRSNSSLQGAYLMLAARSLGLDCGPTTSLAVD